MPRSLRNISIKAAVLLGFGLTLGIWLAAAYAFTLQNQRARARAAAVTARYTDAQDLLAAINAEVLRGSVLLRDAILSAAFTELTDRQPVDRTFETISGALARYVPVSDSSSEQERVRRLRHEIDGVRRWRSELLETATSGSAKDAMVLLRTQGVPRREVVIRIAEELQALNREVFLRQQAEIEHIYASGARWFWGSLALAVAGSFAIGLVAVRYTGQLEDRLQRQLEKDSQNARELQRLSARLITAQEDERRAIARDLHDEVGQRLTAIKVELAAAHHLVETGSLNRDVLTGIQSITDGTLTTIRDLSHLLHPVILDDLGLIAALETQIRAFDQRHRIRINLVHEGVEGRLAPEVETAIYRIVQEALTNVARHARATAGLVRLQRVTSRVALTVEDNGVGFDPAATERGSPGLGLIGIRERALQAGGACRIESAPGRGTRLTVDLPAGPPAPSGERGAGAGLLGPPASPHG